MAYRKSLLPSYVQGSHNKNLKPVVMKAKCFLWRNRAAEPITKTGSQASVILRVFSTSKRKKILVGEDSDSTEADSVSTFSGLHH